MKSNSLWLAIVGLSLLATPTPATVRYVNVNNASPVSPYTNWATAATGIQSAVDVAASGDLVLVTNGVYQTGGRAAKDSITNRVIVDKVLTVQSVNGPAVTIIQGYQQPGTTNGTSSVRCVNLVGGATLSGFTLTNGSTPGSGGGVYCSSSPSTITNCIITGNAASRAGGGGWWGVYLNCLISGNKAFTNGGGIYNGAVTNCLIIGNSAQYGAGVCLGVINNSLLSGNRAAVYGGGACSNTLNNCVIRSNSAVIAGGGAIYSTMNNCLLTGNLAGGGGGGSGGGASASTLNNCTIVRNTGTAGGGGTESSTLNNCVNYYNIGGLGDNNSYNGIFNYCCTTPLPTNGMGNITNEPAFVDLANGDFHLQTNSPCINAGTNAYAHTSADLDGNPRILGGTVDMGAYEFPVPDTHYVNLSNTTPVAPYLTWPTAATNIQDAIDAAIAGDFIVVSNGVYKTGGRALYGVATNRVVVDKAVTVQSVNGPVATIIAGAANTAIPPAGIRCAYLTNGAVLSGFTLTNGSARNSGNPVQEESGGGVWCEDNSAVVSDCVFTGNCGAWYGGGAFRGTLLNCTLTNNTSGFGGAACSNLLVNCVLLRNTASYNNFNSGGGAYYCTLSNCVVVGNTCNGGRGGGGAYSSVLTGCVVSNNFVNGGNGGGVCLGAVNNSLISSNRATGYGGGACSNTLANCVLRNNLAASGGGGAFRGTLLNCTIVSNTAGQWGGGVYGGALTNCIIYYNAAPKNPNVQNESTGVLSYCDITPLATNGPGNITNEPAFVDLAHGNFHLQTNSPCINSGNNVAAPGGTDLDGNPRIVGGTVDMGAYECQSPALLAYYIWLQNYGLPTDASAVYTDTDGDGMNNWQEWQSGTIPTNTLSLLQMTAVINDVSGIIVTWQSVSGKTYFLQRSSDLTAQPAFSTVSSNIVGQAGTTSYLNTTAVGPGPFFYRVGVQP